MSTSDTSQQKQPSGQNERNMQPEANPAPLGLRERKKIKTRASIRREAMRLFQQQGYAETTVEQIAEATEISPSTFFRYFPTKEAVVMLDDFDEPIITAFKGQPPEISPLRALRNALREIFDQLTAEEIEQERQRQRLMTATPELRAAMLVEFSQMIQMISELMAERVGRPADDFQLRTFAGALIGVALAAMLAVTENPEVDPFDLFDQGLAHLEAGVPL